MKGYLRFLQPLGFVLLLFHFIAVKLDALHILFWIGIVLTIAGNIAEINFYFRIPYRSRTQLLGVFLMGVFSKLLLVVAIILRVYDFKYSYFILLACILISFIWFFIQQFIKPVKRNNEEILDVE
ncbi:MAG: hypothetical protein KG003_15975 [Bacteroidetes bacterium]|nr:hypothetical protein [Bacteroidota bacterium]